uniref:Uncharacterized protein n=1 Tax=Anguilla anguilla TaxID=7936 RepID=A0A0E9Y2D8_ANGAN
MTPNTQLKQPSSFDGPKKQRKKLECFLTDQAFPRTRIQLNTPYTR